MKSILGLKDERGLLSTKAEEIINTAKVEKRKLTENESSDFNEITTQMSLLSNEIKLEESRGLQDIKEITQVITNQKTNMENFSLLRAIEARANGKNLSADTLRVIEAGKAEMRKSGVTASGDICLPLEYRADIVAQGATLGQEAVSEQKFGILEPLKASLVLVQAGATFLTGLIGDVSIPTYGGTSALWKGEVAIAADGAGAFAEVNLSPKRITAFIDISKQFLNQDSVSAEAMLMKNIVDAVALKLEATILGKAVGDANQPAGLFATAPSIKGAATYANMVALETAVDTANAIVGNCKYITNAAGRGILKTVPKVAGQPVYLLDGGELNGYPVLVTNNIANALQVGVDENGIIFGNFEDLVIAQWGAIDLIVDPFTVAQYGKVRIVVNAYFDAKIRRTESFKTGSLK